MAGSHSLFPIIQEIESNEEKRSSPASEVQLSSTPISSVLQLLPTLTVQPPSLLGTRDLDNIVLEYIDDDEDFSSEKYDPTEYYANSNLTFFESQLPTRIVNKLVQHAANGEKNKVKAILNEPLLCKPKNLARLRELLCTPATVVDINGREYVNRTVYQVALGVNDYNVVSKKGNKVIEGIVEMLEECYFKELPDDIEVIQEQYQKQYPKGYKEKEQARIESDSNELNQVLKAVAEASDADCQQTMALST